MPGYALWYHFEHKNDAGYKFLPNWVNAISSGVDCIGLVTRSTSYTGSSYNSVFRSRNHDVKNYQDWYIDVQYPYYELVPARQNAIVISDKITDFNNTTPNDDEKYLYLNKIKPGDLMYLEYNDKTGKHIAMVQDVIYSDSMSLESIRLIESAWANDNTWAKVVKTDRTLEKYQYEHWVVVRLK